MRSQLLHFLSFFDSILTALIIIDMQKKKIFITIGAILGGLIATYLGFSIYFMNHFYFRTTINGMNVSGYSVEKVREVSEKGVKDFRLKLLERNEMEEELVGKDFDLEQVWDDSVSNLLKNQNGFYGL